MWRFLKLTIREPRRASPPIQTHISAHRRDAKHRNSVLSAVSFPSSHKLERVPETCTSLPTAAKAELIHRRVGHSGLCSFFPPPPLICKTPAINSTCAFVSAHVCAIYFYSHRRAFESKPGQDQMNSPIKPKWENTKLPPHHIGIDTNGPNRGSPRLGVCRTGLRF